MRGLLRRFKPASPREKINENDDTQARRDREPDPTVAVRLSSGIVLHDHERGPQAAADRARLAARWPAMIERMIASVEDPSVKASDFNQSPDER